MIKTGLSFTFVLCSLNAFAKATENQTALLENDKLSIARDRIATTMQNTAQWFDQLVPGDDNKDATAKGYLMLGVAPRTADLAQLESKFKVSLSLPNWEERINLIIDNDEDSQDRLSYQSSTPIEPKQDDTQINAAIDWWYQPTRNLDIHYRLGVSRSQLYVQSLLKQMYHWNEVQINVRPSLEYYLSDGLGARFNVSLDYPLTDGLSLNLSSSTRFIQDEDTVRFNNGVYLSQHISKDAAGVVGINMTDDFSGERSYYTSYRYRQRFSKPWLFWEVEPFLEYREKNQFHDEVGVALRVIAYYGK